LQHSFFLLKKKWVREAAVEFNKAVCDLAAKRLMPSGAFQTCLLRNQDDTPLAGCLPNRVNAQLDFRAWSALLH